MFVCVCVYMCMRIDLIQNKIVIPSCFSFDSRKRKKTQRKKRERAQKKIVYFLYYFLLVFIIIIIFVGINSTI